jgi:hypothetical protein
MSGQGGVSSTGRGVGRRGTRVMWLAGLVVALGAGVLTAHGLIEVAVGSTVPVSIGWLYPVITDGLALVAYAATTRLAGAGQKYAWSVVVLAAGLSAVAQAAFLAGGAQAAPAQLRFAVGAWPAVAAAITAHLLFLIGSGQSRAGRDAPEGHHGAVSITAEASRREALTADAGVSPGVPSGVEPCEVDHSAGVRVDLDAASARESGDPLGRGVPTGVPGVQVDQDGVRSWDSDTAGVDHRLETVVSQFGRLSGMRPALSPSDRALAMGELHRRRSGALPSVRELAGIAEVSRGTAETALRQLRAQPAGLRLVDDETDQRSQP